MKAMYSKIKTYPRSKARASCELGTRLFVATVTGLLSLVFDDLVQGLLIGMSALSCALALYWFHILMIVTGRGDHVQHKTR